MYAPARMSETVVADTLTDLRGQIDDLSSLTSGQVLGTVARLRRTVAALPVPYSKHGEISNWPSTSAGATMLSLDFQVPEGKSLAQVMVMTSGMCQSNGVRSDQPSFSLRAGTVTSPVLPMVPDNMDSWHILGQFSASIPASYGSVVRVSLVFNGGVIYSGSEYVHRASLDAMVIFTS